ncbi:shikimate dehydrogenase [SAR202 cluster bacterium AD-802-E10_MRT_200m]|nr:shikimate dehydrogenase [SAR202 cluster bacterium AD-802-E10_MRT_200m]
MNTKVGIIGYPIRHSISPIFQQAAFNHFNLETSYEIWETTSQQLPERLSYSRNDDVLGFNVTIPYKEQVLHLLDDITPEALIIGAVNTVANVNGFLRGYNTDTTGFIRALKEKGDFEPKGKTALVLGAGGSARAVCFGLHNSGVTSIIIANRTLNRAIELADHFQNHLQANIVPILLTPKELNKLLSAPNSPDLIVNCTSLGMTGGPNPLGSPLGDIEPSQSTFLADLVYNPIETPFLQMATKSHARSLGGIPMLIYQGAEAFHIWTGKTPPLEILFSAVRTAMDDLS